MKKLSHKQISSKGGLATAQKYTPEERTKRARKLAKIRWAKKPVIIVL